MNKVYLHKNILKVLEMDHFPADITNDPKRAEYYNTLKKFLHCKPVYPLYRLCFKELIKMLKNPGLVYHLLVNELNICEGFYYSFHKQYWFHNKETNTFILKSIEEIEFYLQHAISKLFPPIVFLTYTPTQLKKLANYF